MDFLNKNIIAFKWIFVLTLCLVLFTKCNSNNLVNSNESHCKGPISKKIVYSNKKDSSDYMVVRIYCSGDTCEKIVYRKNILKSYERWFESGGKEKEEKNFIGTKETPYHGKDTASGIVGYIEDIGTFKHWNEKGILIYETNLLPHKREQRITRDSIGNVLKIDTISY